MSLPMAARLDDNGVLNLGTVLKIHTDGELRNFPVVVERVISNCENGREIEELVRGTTLQESLTGLQYQWSNCVHLRIMYIATR